MDHATRIDRLDRLSRLLDTRFSLFGIRFGWDGIASLLPVAGDAATLLPGAWIILESARMGAPGRILARMAINSGLDFALGSIPLIGTIFDVGFRSNRRNVALLREWHAGRMVGDERLELPTSSV